METNWTQEKWNKTTLREYILHLLEKQLLYSSETSPKHKKVRNSIMWLKRNTKEDNKF